MKFKGGVAEQYAADSVRKGEKLTWEEWAKRFDEYMHHLDLLFSPDRIILGGGSSKYFDDFSKWFTVNTTVLPATLLNNAGMAEMSLVDTDKEGTVLFLTIGSGIGSALFTDGS